MKLSSAIAPKRFSLLIPSIVVTICDVKVCPADVMTCERRIDVPGIFVA